MQNVRMSQKTNRKTRAGRKEIKASACRDQKSAKKGEKERGFYKRLIFQVGKARWAHRSSSCLRSRESRAGEGEGRISKGDPPREEKISANDFGKVKGQNRPVEYSLY